MKKIATIQHLFIVLTLLALTLPAVPAIAQYEAGDDYSISWTLDPRSDTDLFSHGNDGYGARSVLVGMDFDNDGNKEILFTTDETLAPGGPDPGQLDVFLYENNGNDSYEYVWHYTHEPSNSLPALAYGDLDEDGLWEIYFGIPTINGDPTDLFVFEQNEDLTFPDTPTTTWDYGKDGALDFRPAAFAIADVDGDGQQELVTGSRKSGAREIVVGSPNGPIDAFTVWTNEFEAGEDVLGGGAIYDLDVADFDNDGKMEIWVNTWDLFSFAIFESTGADAYELQADINQAYPDYDHGSFNSHKLLFSDMDSDGRDELVVPTTNGFLFYLDDVEDVSTITGASFVQVGGFLEEGDGTETRGADLGDVDNDGLTDIVVGLGGGEKVIGLEFQGGDPTDFANYERSTILTQTAESADRFYPLRIADDLDGDGKKEIVVTNLYASEAGQQMIIVVESNTGTGTRIETDRPEMPAGYALSQNYPNPFNPSTTVVFEVPETVNVDVSVFDVAGRLIRTLSSGVVAAGTHSVTFEAQDLPSGMYIIVMQTPHGALTRKAMLLK